MNSMALRTKDLGNELFSNSFVALNVMKRALENAQEMEKERKKRQTRRHNYNG